MTVFGGLSRGTINAADEVLKERISQDARWGEQNHTPDRWLAILMEEVGEMAKENLECRPLLYRAELIQVAAVAVAMLECFDRNADPNENLATT